MVMALLVAAFGGGFVAGRVAGMSVLPKIVRSKATDEPPRAVAGVGVVDEIIHIINRTYVDPISDTKLVDGAINGVVQATRDPYTGYMGKQESRAFSIETQGKFGGVGIELGMKDHQLMVIAPMEGTPAYRAGVKAGDAIMEVDGKSTKGWTTEKAVGKIRGEEGTKVVLTMKRKGKPKLLRFKLTRGTIKLVNVTSKVLEGKVGYIHLHSFSESSGQDVRRELAKLEKKGVRALILDLRNNPGGLLEQSISVASIFIENGVIVKQKGRTGKTETAFAQGDADTNIPLAVLVNKGSASASEIVAGAIQDHKRGKIIGENTFGKASVQRIFELSNGGSLRVTIAHYFTPDGRNIAKKGITPDIIVKQPHGRLLTKTDKQLQKALELLRSLFGWRSPVSVLAPAA